MPDEKPKSHRLFWIGVAVLIGWWFFLGDDPVQLVRAFVGRGRKLSQTTLDPSGSVLESVENIVAQVSESMGRPVAEDAVLLSRVSANEHAGASLDEKAAIQWVCKNDADSHGWSVRYTVTVNPGTLGVQSGRRYSTHGGGVLGVNESHEDDLFVAESILNGSIPDPTGGAAKFVHITGYADFADFLQGHPKVAGWVASGLSPVYLPNCSTLVVLRREA